MLPSSYLSGFDLIKCSAYQGYLFIVQLISHQLGIKLLLIAVCNDESFCNTSKFCNDESLFIFVNFVLTSISAFACNQFGNSAKMSFGLDD
jgi:hypothetical protein